MTSFKNTLSLRVHFYYCLLIAIRLQAGETPRWVRAEKNIFVLSWAEKARAGKIFDYTIDSEIDWIISVLKTKGPFNDIEVMIEDIYFKGLRLSLAS